MAEGKIEIGWIMGPTFRDRRRNYKVKAESGKKVILIDTTKSNYKGGEEVLFNRIKLGKKYDLAKLEMDKKKGIELIKRNMTKILRSDYDCACFHK